MKNQSQINDLEFLDDITKTWLSAQLLKDGPWNIKTTLREKVNCFLHYFLSGIQANHDVRGYLTSDDPDDVWIRCVKQYVVPQVFLTARGEVNG